MCPDFFNINGQKKVIEMFGDYWHQGQNPQDKIDRYAKSGFDCLVIWERELKEKSRTELTTIIKVFSNKEQENNKTFEISVVKERQLNMFDYQLETQF